MSAVVRETDLPVRVLLREPGGPEAAPDSFARMAANARDCLELGAAGFAFGFFDRDLEVDRASCAELAAGFAEVPWTFAGIDAALAGDRAWRDALGLPGLDAISCCRVGARTRRRTRRPNGAAAPTARAR